MTLIWRLLHLLGIHDARWFVDVQVCARCPRKIEYLGHGHWEPEITGDVWVEHTEITRHCMRPPAGWYCPRDEYHTGPCPARRV